MPQVFKIGQYWVYFWANENEPLEPIHVHVSPGMPQENATKIWITRRGKCLLSNNRSRIPRRMKQLMNAKQEGQIIERPEDVIKDPYIFEFDRLT